LFAISENFFLKPTPPILTANICSGTFCTLASSFERTIVRHWVVNITT
jgi:hypothetical protein